MSKIIILYFLDPLKQHAEAFFVDILTTANKRLDGYYTTIKFSKTMLVSYDLGEDMLKITELKMVSTFK